MVAMTKEVQQDLGVLETPSLLTLNQAPSLLSLKTKHMTKMYDTPLLIAQLLIAQMQ